MVVAQQTIKPKEEDMTAKRKIAQKRLILLQLAEKLRKVSIRFSWSSAISSTQEPRWPGPAFTWWGIKFHSGRKHYFTKLRGTVNRQRGWLIATRFDWNTVPCFLKRSIQQDEAFLFDLPLPWVPRVWLITISFVNY